MKKIGVGSTMEHKKDGITIFFLHPIEIWSGEKELKRVGYSDSDWAGDHVDRKSTSGFAFMLNRGPISYASRKQAVIALSCTEAEYVALSLAAREATWLRPLLTELVDCSLLLSSLPTPTRTTSALKQYSSFPSATNPRLVTVHFVQLDGQTD